MLAEMAAQEAESAEDGAGDASGADDVVDADFEVVDDTPADDAEGEKKQ